MRGDGKRHIPLEKVPGTMRDTSRGVKDEYEEPSLGGLAVDVIER